MQESFSQEAQEYQRVTFLPVQSCLSACRTEKPALSSTACSLPQSLSLLHSAQATGHERNGCVYFVFPVHNELLIWVSVWPTSLGFLWPTLHNTYCCSCSPGCGGFGQGYSHDSPEVQSIQTTCALKDHTFAEVTENCPQGCPHWTALLLYGVCLAPCHRSASLTYFFSDWAWEESCDIYSLVLLQK